MLLLLYRPDALLQLDQASHVRGEVVVLAARRGRLVAAVLLVLVGHHLLDAYHGLRLTDQRHLGDKTGTCLGSNVSPKCVYPQDLKLVLSI